MKFPALIPVPACFLLSLAFLAAPSQGASSVPAIPELPGEEVIVLPDGRYTTPSELGHRTDSLRQQEKTKNDAGKSRGKEKNRGKSLRNTASIGPGYLAP